MKIIDWQCHFTEHQSHTWLAAQQVFDEEIIHVVARTSSDVREKQGWSSIDLSGMKTIDFKQQGWWKQGVSILGEYPNAIHVFGGFWADKRFFPLILYALWRGHKVVVMNEAYATESVGYLSNTSGWKNRLKVWLRPKLYQCTAWMIKMLSAPHQFCVLAFSERAAGQFEAAGFAHDQVFAFGYFVPALKDVSVALKQDDDDVVRVIFVGSLLKVKGLDLLVDAVENLCAKGESVQLDVYGHGDPESYINPESCCVSYEGSIPFGQAQAMIAEYDALVLPSLHDGWGVVVNEALLQGVPVIVSSNVGAKCLLESSGAGMVFESGSIDSLQGVLKEFVGNSRLRKEMRNQAMQMSAMITPEHAAKYMSHAMKFYFERYDERPKELWCK